MIKSWRRSSYNLARIISTLSLMSPLWGCNAHFSGNTDDSSKTKSGAGDLGGPIEISHSPTIHPEQGANLVLEIRNFREAKSAGEKICAVALVGTDSLEPATYRERAQCIALSPSGNPSSSSRNAAKKVQIKLKNVPIPAYILAFHDQNGNGSLDFTTASLLFRRETTAAEGYGRVEEGNIGDPNVVSQLIFLSPGENSRSVDLSYDPTPLEKLLVSTAWQSLHGWVAGRNPEAAAGSAEDRDHILLQPSASR